MDRYEISNLYRGPSIDASYQVSVHLAEHGRSSIKFAHFVPIHLQTWPPQAILVSDWPIFKKYSPLKLEAYLSVIQFILSIFKLEL
jgi:hypothetical protein